MKVNIYGKNITVTPALSEKIEKKLNHLEKYFMIDDSVVANVVVRVYQMCIRDRYYTLKHLRHLEELAHIHHDFPYARLDSLLDMPEVLGVCQSGPR